MEVNNTSIVLEIFNLLNDTNLGSLTNKVLVTFGGIASVTIIYFFVMIYFQSQSNKRIKELRSDIDLIIILVHEQGKKIDKIHKVLIPEDTQDKSNEQNSQENI